MNGFFTHIYRAGSVIWRSVAVLLLVTASASFTSQALAVTPCADGLACNASSINNVIHIDGVTHTTIASALAACPSEGCVIDATSRTADIGYFDPTGRAVSLRLGPYSYKVNQIVLRPGLEIIGLSRITKLVSQDNSIPVIVLPNIINETAFGVRLQGLVIVAPPQRGANQTAIYLDSTVSPNNGLWYSTFEDIQIGGFNGVGLYLKGVPITNTYDRLNQFNQFRNIVVRREGSGEALRIEGNNGQLLFLGGEFDGKGQFNSPGPNVFIGTSGPQNPYSIKFVGTSVQNGEIGMLFKGTTAIDIDSMHFENLSGGLKFENGGAQNGQIVVHNSAFGLVGINGGAGYLIDSQASGPLLSLTFRTNTVQSMPDKFYIPSTPSHTQSIRWMDNTTPYPTPSANFRFGTTLQTSPTSGGVLTTGPARVVAVNTPSTVSSLESTLGPSEIITLYNVGPGVLTFQQSSSFFTGSVASFQLAMGDSATFVREDLNLGFRLISTSKNP